MGLHFIRWALPALIIATGICDTSFAKQNSRRPYTLRSRFDGHVIVNEYNNENVFDYTATDRQILDTATILPKRFATTELGISIAAVAGFTCPTVVDASYHSRSVFAVGSLW